MISHPGRELQANFKIHFTYTSIKFSSYGLMLLVRSFTSNCPPFIITSILPTHRSRTLSVCHPATAHHQAFAYTVFFLFGMFLHSENSNLSFMTQLKHFILCEVSINSSGQIDCLSFGSQDLRSSSCYSLDIKSWRVFSTRWWDSNYKGQYLTYSHMPSKWHIQCCWINLSNIYYSTNIYRALVIWQAGLNSWDTMVSKTRYFLCPHEETDIHQDAVGYLGNEAWPS